MRILRCRKLVALDAREADDDVGGEAGLDLQQIAVIDAATHTVIHTLGPN